MEKHCKRQIPDESTLRKNYVTVVYQETIQKIKEKVGNNNLWFAVDETTDCCGRYVTNLIIGILNNETPTKGFLICSKELNKTNSSTLMMLYQTSFCL